MSQFWTPIGPKGGSLLQADSQAATNVFFLEYNFGSNSDNKKTPTEVGVI